MGTEAESTSTSNATHLLPGGLFKRTAPLFNLRRRVQCSTDNLGFQRSQSVIRVSAWPQWQHQYVTTEAIEHRVPILAIADSGLIGSDGRFETTFNSACGMLVASVMLATTNRA